jgi:hypothetical protein
VAGPYSDLSDEELTARIVKYRDAQDQVVMGGNVAVIAGEGRRIEYTRSNASSIAAILSELLAERNRRPSMGGSCGGNALPIWIC